jgi:glucosyl-3-phosphoglycerate synthase
LAIRPGLIECVNQLRRNGFMVGVLSDSYFVAADIIRRRIFADFALAHTIGFEHEVCTGQLRMNSAFVRPAADGTQAVCKSNALRCLLEDPQLPAITLTWAVSSKPIDAELLRMADKAFCIGNVAPWALEVGATKLASFDDLVAPSAD